MHTKKATFILSTSLLTAFTLAGSIILLFAFTSFLQGGPVSPHGLRDYVAITLLAVALIFGSGAVGGGLWGLGIAAFMGVDGRSPALRGALTWGGTLVAAGLLLYISQIPIAAIDRQLHISLHILFSAVFVPVVGLAAAINTRLLAGKMEETDGLRNMAAKNAGLAAAFGFLLMSLMLFLLFDWEVGRPYRNTNMISIMHLCNIVACFAGGAALGWTLTFRAQQPERNLTIQSTSQLKADS